MATHRMRGRGSRWTEIIVLRTADGKKRDMSAEAGLLGVINALGSEGWEAFSIDVTEDDYLACDRTSHVRIRDTRCWLRRELS